MMVMKLGSFFRLWTLDFVLWSFGLFGFFFFGSFLLTLLCILYGGGGGGGEYYFVLLAWVSRHM